MTQEVLEFDLRKLNDGAVFNDVDDFADEVVVINEAGRKIIPVDGIRFVVDRTDARGYHWEDYTGIPS